jgi:hypothetical protein
MSGKPGKCSRKENACIEGDAIYIECRKPDDWRLFRMTNNHNGHRCKAKKNAKAILLKTYTNCS